MINLLLCGQNIAGIALRKKSNNKKKKWKKEMRKRNKKIKRRRSWNVEKKDVRQKNNGAKKGKKVRKAVKIIVYQDVLYFEVIFIKLYIAFNKIIN